MADACRTQYRRHVPSARRSGNREPTKTSNVCSTRRAALRCCVNRARCRMAVRCNAVECRAATASCTRDSRRAVATACRHTPNAACVAEVAWRTATRRCSRDTASCRDASDDDAAAAWAVTTRHAVHARPMPARRMRRTATSKPDNVRRAHWRSPTNATHAAHVATTCRRSTVARSARDRRAVRTYCRQPSHTNRGVGAAPCQTDATTATSARAAASCRRTTHCHRSKATAHRRRYQLRHTCLKYVRRAATLRRERNVARS